MGKTKNTSKGFDDSFLEMSPTRTHESPLKDAWPTVTDTRNLPNSARLMTLTGSSKKAKKMQKKGENECSQLQAKGHQENGNLKKRKQLKDEKDLKGADGSLGETSPHEASPRKKKKQQLEQTEVNITCEVSTKDASETSRKKKKKSSRRSSSVDPHDTQEVSVTMEWEESETKNNGKREEHVKKKKNKVKRKDSSILAEQLKDVESIHTHTAPIETDEVYKEPASPMRQTGTAFTKKKYSKGDEKMIDRHLLEELKEFVPNVESRSLNDINKMINYDLPRYKEFKKEGFPLNRGRFTVEENETLRKNVENFMALTGIDSATKLFFTHYFKEEQENIKKLKRVHKFFERIAEGIPRSCHDVYARGRRVFDSSNHKGKFSEEEIHTLCKLHTMYGNNWKRISELTGRSAISLEKRYSQIAVKEGRWSPKEIRRLLRAVRDHIVNQLQLGATNEDSFIVSREMLYKRLPWQKIAAKVETRSWTKCREKWMSVLAVKMSSGAVNAGENSDEVKVKLIKAMYEMQVDDVAYVNWDDLTTVIGDVPPSYVQRKWHKLKVCHVPNWQNKSFGDTIDFLYENVLPHLEKELEHHGGETRLNENQKETFLLSEIFPDINEDDDDDDDEDIIQYIVDINTEG
ncbi:transcription termination factor 1-like [Colossoma macropomum]|uniref:transcription termination factor 1-like n=1 Tax=Colossoma macropomum TaxID=42526 RepID=UPI001864E801|nr:transcription termination factor 1-like [Colossoma macropomum]